MVTGISTRFKGSLAYAYIVEDLCTGESEQVHGMLLEFQNYASLETGVSMLRVLLREKSMQVSPRLRFFIQNINILDTVNEKDWISRRILKIA